MKAYKVVSVIDGKFYSYSAHPSTLLDYLKDGTVVEYELDKKTIAPLVNGLRYLSCFNTLDNAILYIIFWIGEIDHIGEYKIFEIEYEKCDNIMLDQISPDGTIFASSITLIKEIPISDLY